MTLLEDVTEVVIKSLELENGALPPEGSRTLLGGVAELDSMAVVMLITALEERFKFTFEDEDMSADVFGTLGTLTALVERKLGR